VASVDGYQGREKEAIVMSTVRSSSGGGIGFVADWRRANVAMTRAKRGLIVFGDPCSLAREESTWAPWLRWVAMHGLCAGVMPALPAEPPGGPRPVGLAAERLGQWTGTTLNSRVAKPAFQGQQAQWAKWSAALAAQVVDVEDDEEDNQEANNSSFLNWDCDLTQSISRSGGGGGRHSQAQHQMQQPQNQMQAQQQMQQHQMQQHMQQQMQMQYQSHAASSTGSTGQREPGYDAFGITRELLPNAGGMDVASLAAQGYDENTIRLLVQLAAQQQQTGGAAATGYQQPTAGGSMGGATVGMY